MIGSLILIVAPIAIVLSLILVVVAYHWLLIVALVLWFLYITNVPDEASAKPNGVLASSDQIAAASQQGAESPALTAPPPATKAEARAAPNIKHGREGGDRMIVLTWNLGRRTHPGQAELVLRTGAACCAPRSEDSTDHMGREFSTSGLIHQHGASAGTRSFPFASRIASHWPIRDAAADGLEVPFPERRACRCIVLACLQQNATSVRPILRISGHGPSRGDVRGPRADQGRQDERSRATTGGVRTLESGTDGAHRWPSPRD